MSGSYMSPVVGAFSGDFSGSGGGQTELLLHSSHAIPSRSGEFGHLRLGKRPLAG